MMLLITYRFLSGRILTGIAPFIAVIQWVLWARMEGIVLFSSGYCPFQAWMHFCIYNGPSSPKGFSYFM